ncbi:general secretory pathway protein GspE [Chitinimonas prasina]|uniref:General secretory pathway protein GspE n=1 Tax=Chitinimonas prasina TaxID=1434937 RepID=A0ABQ5YCS3_9NEIS|nr:ATPase, T2SS/T4P/T4SS family [Chitinimonas prasina]GLR11793.1 general secretory pathway protein GspE [Chitinimonas prasina]
MNQPAAAPELNIELQFIRDLQAVTNKIHATSNVDEIMLEVSQSICELFNADRLTIYVLNDEQNAIVSKVKIGLNSFKDLKLPITEQSVAGYVAMSKKLVNIKDVYDVNELKAIHPQLTFLQEVDKRTGYRTKQMMVAPIVEEKSGGLIGVVQLINNRAGRPFPGLTEKGAVELCKTLAIALKQRQHGGPFVARTKYDYLVLDGVLSATELELAIKGAREHGTEIEDILLKEFKVNAAQVGASLARFFGVEYEPFKPDRIKPLDLVKSVKRDFAEMAQWLPVEEGKDGVMIITPDPEKVRSSGMAGQVFPGKKLIYRVCSLREFGQSLDLFFGSNSAMDGSSIGDLLSGLSEDSDEVEGVSSEALSLAQDNELVKLVNKVIVDAYQQGASDIHIEPFPGKGKTEIRFRKDGSLQPYIEVPSAYRDPIVTRLKIMCDLDISERRKPQDGKIKFKKYGPLDIELRVATVPTAGGMEDVVMRILASGEPLPLDKMGFSKRNDETLRKVISKPYGLFFVCGPTGSGKTTTLHSVLKHLNTSETKIWTAEDPVEITQKGLRQVQMNPKAGLTFAVAMKAFLRADPDIIMVGEMRDKETTSTGIEASLTGHLVLATLHTNSAPESIIRLLDMGMDPFNFSDALLGILAQRLAKRLCAKCKQAYQPDDAELKLILAEYAEELKNTASWAKDPAAAQKALMDEWRRDFAGKDGKFTLYKPVGCEACNGTGYKGRVGLHELLVGTDAVKKRIQEHARVAELLAVALDEGMRTLKQDGIEKVLQGVTDLHQVRAVCIK